MKDHPILFSAPMVHAILGGQKSQTRRVVKQRITGPNPPAGIFDWHHPKTDTWLGAHGGGIVFSKTNAAMLCPYGQPGDRLWVRETWRPVNDVHADYAADYDASDRALLGPWKPSIHMPRWASRITLEIVSVRVERLQDISEADAIAEGTPGGHGAIPGYSYSATPGEHYRWLWEQINGPGAWEANPWVWVIEFKRVEA